MTLHNLDNGEGQFAPPPVFNGLEKLGQNGQNIAEIVGVSPPTVSKWRNGHVAVPDEIVALLTLVLASFLEDRLGQNAERGESGGQSFGNKAGLAGARADLSAQEKVNDQLQPIAMRAGAIKYRYWWNKQLRNQMPVMALDNKSPERRVSLA